MDGDNIGIWQCDPEWRRWGDCKCVEGYLTNIYHLFVWAFFNVVDVYMILVIVWKLSSFPPALLCLDLICNVMSLSEVITGLLELGHRSNWCSSKSICRIVTVTVPLCSLCMPVYYWKYGDNVGICDPKWRRCGHWGFQFQCVWRLQLWLFICFV